MTVPALSAAKWLAQKSGWRLTNLQLQKILYLAHMFYLGRRHGEPLVTGHFEAWDYGPVHPELYHRAKVFGSSPVRNIFHGTDDLDAGAERDILDEAYEALGHLRPGQLVNATHRPNGAWWRHYEPSRRSAVIPNEDILREYEALNDSE